MTENHTPQDSVSAGNTRPGGRGPAEHRKAREILATRKKELRTWRRVAGSIGSGFWNPGYLYKVAVGESPPSRILLRDLGLLRKHSRKGGGFRVSGSVRLGVKLVQMLSSEYDDPELEKLVTSIQRQIL